MLELSHVQESAAAGSISSHPQLPLTYMEICWKQEQAGLGKCHTQDYKES